MRHAMSIDLDLCVGCKACVSACKEQWDTGPGAARDWVHTYESGTRGKDLAVTFYPGLCMQCETHPCTTDCPTGATFIDARTGVVVVDPDVCIGCGNCISNCPYGARHYDPDKKIVEKCNLCAPFVARGEQPACVQTCPAECRVFGDLDDPESAVSRQIQEKGAKPLAVPGIDVRPKTTFAGDGARARILAQGVVKKPEKSWLTRTWSGATLPLTRTVVPSIGLVAVGGGLLVNLKARMDRVRREEAEPPVPERDTAQAEAALDPDSPRELHRHRLGMRVLHWFNATSWVVLLVTGIGLVSAASFAFFGTGFPRALSELARGKANLVRLHVGWGIVWGAVIVPVFLLFKHGPREVLHEVRVTGDDLRWLLAKPLAMAGLRAQPLPPQDKYNAGQKLFALFVLIATTAILATGLVMTFHVGSAGVVAAAILVHKLAIALAVVGVAVHVSMAAIIAEERPALRSMFTGHIDYHHAKHHSPKWVAALEGRPLEKSEQKEE
jgi:sulfite dehydrogenase (quinone) subunit SoeB